MTDPATRAKRGLDVLTTLTGSDEGARLAAAAFERLGALGSAALRTGLGEIWSRPGLSRRDRSLVVISALTAMGRERELRAHVAGGLNHGLTPDEVDEIMVQLSAYVGMPLALGGAGVVAQVLAERDGTETRETPPPPPELKDDTTCREDGMDVLRTLLGMPEGTDMEFAETATIEQLGDMGVLVLDHAFGEIWSRPQLGRRDRSLVVISALTASSLAHELEIHLGAALNHGVTRDEICEVMITMVLYGGFPRAIDGMHLATKVFAAPDAAE